MKTENLALLVVSGAFYLTYRLFRECVSPIAQMPLNQQQADFAKNEEREPVVGFMVERDEEVEDE